jgi:hypothetical protein
MSDRASTEKTFNSLLEQFRNDILPDVIDNWNELCIAEPISFPSINNRSNFFKLSSHESARPTSKWRPQKKLFIFEHKVFCFSFGNTARVEKIPQA